MKTINRMEDLQALVRAGEVNWKQYGEVNTTYYDGLVLFNYSAQAQYMGRWNWFEINSRGLILDAVTGEIVARPMRKFFNYGQWVPMPGTHIVSVAEKLDGSLAILLKHRGEYRIATRGSFTSEQAVWATKWFREYAKHVDELRDDLTYLFEVIYPENRVVVDYKGREGLWLIGARNKQHGFELYEAELDIIAEHHGFYRPVVYRMESIEDVMAATAAMTAHEEGFVVRYSDNERVKVKSEAYMIAHRIMTNANFGHVLDAVRQNRFDAMIEGVPDEFLGQVREWKTEIDTTLQTALEGCRAAMEIAPTESRKDFALWVRANYTQPMESYLFAYSQGKDITDLVYKVAFQSRVEMSLPRANEDG